MLAAFFLSACAPKAVLADRPMKIRPAGTFCGRSTNGPCETDSDCLKGGCSGQVCQSVKEPPVITTCEWRDCYDPAPFGLQCGCVNGACRWR